MRIFSRRRLPREQFEYLRNKVQIRRPVTTVTTLDTRMTTMPDDTTKTTTISRIDAGTRRARIDAGTRRTGRDAGTQRRDYQVYISSDGKRYTSLAGMTIVGMLTMPTYAD